MKPLIQYLRGNSQLQNDSMVDEKSIVVFPTYNFSNIWHDYDINNEPEIIPDMIIDIRLSNGVLMTDAPMTLLKKGEFALRIAAYKLKPDVKRICFKENHNNQVFHSNGIGKCFDCEKENVIILGDC